MTDETAQVADDTLLAAAATAARAVPQDEQLYGARELALKLVYRMNEADDLRARLEGVEADVLDLSRRQLPEKLQALGLEELKLTGGATLELKPFVAVASVTDERRERLFRWLESVGAGDLVKNYLTCAFARGEDSLARFIHRLAQAAGLTVELKKSVHHQTLQAFVRQRLEAGEPVDRDAVDYFAGLVVKLKLPKEVTLEQLLSGDKP